MASPAATGARLKQRFSRTHVAALVGILLAVGTGWFLHTFRLGAGLKHASYDLLHIWRGDVKTDEALIVYLDDESHRKLEQPQNAPWNRSLHARLVERLTDAGARAVVFDIVFSDPDTRNSGADEQLAAALKKHGRVVLGADNIPLGAGAMKIVPPFDLLLESAAAIGSVERVPDGDLVVRRHTPRGDSPVSTLSWATAEMIEATVTKQPGAEQMPRWLNYYGRANSIPWRSYYEVLQPGGANDSEFSHKVVFVGARVLTKFAGDRKDEFPNPFSALEGKPSFMAGVELQATEFLNLLRGDWLTRLPFAAERWLIIALGVLLGGGLIFLRPVRAAIAAVLTFVLLAITSYLVFTRKLVWFPWLIVVCQISVALAWSALFNSVQLYVQKRLFEFTLGLYLSPKLVAKFSSSPSMLKPGAEKQTLTFLFSDIANFTTISEGMDGDEFAAMMNDYFQPAANCIHKSEGTVVKYIGDAIFAFWNAPEPQPDHAARACEAALLFCEQSKNLVRGRLLRTRIGLHTGVANVGNFGSEDRVDYTAIGESVNLASRMEGLNKHLGTDCLMSGATKAEIGDAFVTRRLGQIQMKGFGGLVEVYELVGFAGQAEESRGWREAFAEALNNFEQRNLVFAEIGFRRVLEQKPDDGPSRFYLERIKDLASQDLPELWATHTVVKEK